MATSMSEKTQILFKILSLYLVSSVLFLGYFFINDYKNKKNALILNEVKSLKEIKMGIYMKARMNGLDSISSLTKEKGVNACIVLKNDEKIYKDFDCQKIDKSKNGKNVNISSKESDLLALFLQNKGKILTKDEIFNKIWKFNEEPSELSLRVYIKNLRQILGKDAILNRRGDGYIYVWKDANLI